jgi:hypothetical protein
MMRPGCPGLYHTANEGEHNGSAHCPWEDGAVPEGQAGLSPDEFCAVCAANQQRAEVVNAPVAVVPRADPREGQWY